MFKTRRDIHSTHGQSLQVIKKQQKMDTDRYHKKNKTITEKIAQKQHLNNNHVCSVVICGGMILSEIRPKSSKYKFCKKLFPANHGQNHRAIFSLFFNRYTMRFHPWPKSKQKVAFVVSLFYFFRIYGLDPIEPQSIE